MEHIPTALKFLRLTCIGKTPSLQRMAKALRHHMDKSSTGLPLRPKLRVISMVTRDDDFVYGQSVYLVNIATMVSGGQMKSVVELVEITEKELLRTYPEFETALAHKGSWGWIGKYH